MVVTCGQKGAPLYDTLSVCVIQLGLYVQVLSTLELEWAIQIHVVITSTEMYVVETAIDGRDYGNSNSFPFPIYFFFCGY